MVRVSGSRAIRLLFAVAAVLAAATVATAVGGRKHGVGGVCSRTQAVVKYCAKAFAEAKGAGGGGGGDELGAIRNADAASRCCGEAQAQPFECGGAIRRALAVNQVGGDFAETGCLSTYACADQ